MYNPAMAETRPLWVGHSWTAAPAGVLPRVVAAQWAQRPPWGRTRRIVHPFWVLDYARSDCGLVRVGSPRAPWRRRAARTVHLYPPGTPYWEDASSAKAPVLEAWATFAGGEQAGLGRFVDRRIRFARLADPAGILERPLHEMALAGQSRGEEGFWRAQAALAEILDLLRTAAMPANEDASDAGSAGATDLRPGAGWVLRPPGAEAGAPRGIVEAARDYFREHLAERVTVAAVARHLRISPSAFAHGFAAEAGEPPMAALAGLRMDLARNLLLRGLKMEAVALQTGFCDAFHFSKAFRRRCGLPPSRFRGDFQRRLRPPPRRQRA
jgi:AraC-like DNA-binding protein